MEVSIASITERSESQLKAIQAEEEVKEVITKTTPPVDHLIEHDESKRTLARNISAATFAESDAHGEFILNSKVCDTATKETEKAVEPEKIELNEKEESKEKEKGKKEEELYPTEAEVASAEKQQKASKVSIKLSKVNQHIIKKKRQVSSIEDTKRD